MKQVCIPWEGKPGTPVSGPGVKVGDLCFTPDYGEALLILFLIVAAAMAAAYLLHRARSSNLSSTSRARASPHTLFMWTLFLTFWAVYILSAAGTLGMLFLGFGTVLPSERSILIGAFLVESAVAMSALFYALFKLSPPART